MSDAEKIVENLLGDSEPADPKEMAIQMKDEEDERLRTVGDSWRFYSYDVWGNAEEGYEVNNVFRTSEFINIPEPALANDQTLFAHLQQIGFLKPTAQVENFSSDGDEGIIYLEYDGRPEGELRKENEE
jgi:hypothetical protein